MTRRLPSLVAVLTLAWVAAIGTAEEKGFEPLFDGKSLKGWEGNLKMFRVENKAIVAGTLKTKIPHNDFLCTRREFENFELRLQARLIGKGHNAGIQFRSQRIPKHFEVKGYQCDVGDMNGRSIWGSLYDESRRRKFLAQGDNDKVSPLVKLSTVRADGWVNLVIRCEGPRTQIWVNGLQTVDYVEKDKGIPRRGIIGLQIHSGEPAEAWYRKIRIRKL